MSAALNLPEGFENVSPRPTVVFQNAKNWLTAGEDGIMVIGTFEGLTEPDSYGKLNYKITATESGRTIDKEGKELTFPAGTPTIVNTCDDLSKKMKEVEVGQEVAIIYNGQIKKASGPHKGKMVHSYTVGKR